MALAPLQPAASSPRPTGPARTSTRTAGGMAGPRLGLDARRVWVRESSTALPQVPAKFLGPEDFKSYVDVITGAIRALETQAAGPKATLMAAEHHYRQVDAAATEQMRQSQAEVEVALSQTAGQNEQIELALSQTRAGVEAARYPGRQNATKLQKEVEVLQRRVDNAQAAIDAQQALLDDGNGVGQTRAAAYAIIATNQYTLAVAGETLAAKQSELLFERARVSPDYDPLVRDAIARLQDLEQRVAQYDGGGRMERLAMHMDEVQTNYDRNVEPARQELMAARAAYAPASAAIEAATAQLASSPQHVTKTQRALWWARGFQIDRYVAEQLAGVAL